jgi:Glycosyltransferases, probably involved in cell wall biogenesis
MKTGLPSELCLSVVIPCLDVERLLPIQLEALSSQSCPESWEVVVADNGSADLTRQVAESFRIRFPELRVVFAHRRGRHHACNAGARAARGKSLIFVDADDEVAPGYLAAMHRGLADHEFVGGRLEHQRMNAPALWNVGNVQSDGLIDGLGFYPFVGGGNMGVSRRVFELVGGFRDKPYCEDIDFSWRAQLNGIHPVFLPDAVVHVRQRNSLRSMFLQHRRFGSAQALLYRDFRRNGMPMRSAADVARDWLAIGKSVAMLAVATPDERIRWTRRTARALGRLSGSLRHGVFYP